MNNKDLIEKAKAVPINKQINDLCTIGSVGAALITDKGNVYVGSCLDLSSGLGFCAEVSAISNMITAGETKIKTIVAARGDGSILSPCGRCRETMSQVDKENMDSEVILSDKVVKLKDLLPNHWWFNEK